MKHKLEGTEVWCHARGCRGRIEWGTREWTRRWVSVWVKEDNTSYDVCSLECARKIEAGHYVKERKTPNRRSKAT